MKNSVAVTIERIAEFLRKDKIENLRLIKHVENLFAKEGYGEFTTHEIENLIFGNANYL